MEDCVPNGRRNVRPGEAIITSILTALQPRDFCQAVTEKVTWEDSGKDKDSERVLKTLDEMKIKYLHHAYIKEEHMAAGRGGGRCDSIPRTNRIGREQTW